MLAYRLRLISLFLLICLALAGCTSAQATRQPTPADPPPPNLALDGIWVGKTSQDKEVFFTITGSKLTQFQLKYAFETCKNSKYSVIIPAPGFGRYDGNTLSLKTPNQVTITFASASSAQGTFDFDTSQGVLASSCQPGLKETIPFTVTKQLKQTTPGAPLAATPTTP